jgi:hypothetical protein
MAGNKFDSISALMKHIENEVILSLKIVAEDIRQIIKDYVEKEVYQAYTPHEYSRTYELLNSLEISEIKKIGNVFSFDIFFNPDKIGMYDTRDKWNQHKSVYGYETWHGMKLNELIPWFIENGTEGGLWDRDGIYAMEYVKERLENTNEHLKKIVKVLKSKGYDVRIV